MSVSLLSLATTSPISAWMGEPSQYVGNNYKKRIIVGCYFIDGGYSHVVVCALCVVSGASFLFCYEEDFVVNQSEMFLFVYQLPLR